MLANIDGVMVPRRTPRDLIAFIKKHKHTRFCIGTVLPNTGSSLYIEEAYFDVTNWRNEIRVKTYANSYSRPFGYYAFDHIQFVIPVNKKGRQRNDPGWLHPDAMKNLNGNEEHYYYKSLLQWMENNPNVN